MDVDCAVLLIENDSPRYDDSMGSKKTNAVPEIANIVDAILNRAAGKIAVHRIIELELRAELAL